MEPNGRLREHNQRRGSEGRIEIKIERQPFHWVKRAHQPAFKHPPKLNPENQVRNGDHKTYGTRSLTTFQQRIRPNDDGLHWRQTQWALDAQRKVTFCFYLLEWPLLPTSWTIWRPLRRALIGTGESTMGRISSFSMTFSERSRVSECEVNEALY